MTGEPVLRPASGTDLEAVVDIYNHYVANTAITFDTRPFTPDERRDWFRQFRPDGIHRLLVAECDGGVVGYASSSRLKPRAAYDQSVETTIYLAPSATGRGTGVALYGELLDGLTHDPRLHRAYGGITLPNAASVALHAKLGFTHVGTYHEVGYKFGRYHDVAWFEKDLSGPPRHPARPGARSATTR